MDVTTADALYQGGLKHMQAGRNLDAQLCCRQALALDAGHADTMHLLGLLCLQAGQYDLALEWISRAIRQHLKSEYFLSLGTLLQLQGRHDEVVQVCDKAINLGFDNAGLWMLRGTALSKLERHADAVQSFQHVIRLNPQHWDAAHQCAILLHHLGRMEESLACLELCDRLRPNHAATLRMRAALLHGLKRFEEALALCRQAQALEPDNADICDKLGIVLRSLGRDEEALLWFDRALALRPDFTDALHNKAAALVKLHRFDEAFATYEHLRATDTGDALAELGIAQLHLLMGNFEAGWAGREARWRMARRYPKFGQAMWLGEESLKDKTLLIVADEGLGDTIQFVRYVPMAASLGARIILVVQDALLALLSNLPGIAQCIPISAAGSLPPFDLHCPTMSLPLAFGTRMDTIPAPTSYLPVPEDRVHAWTQRLGPRERLRVGIVWSGNPHHPDDHNRSIPLRAFSRILDIDAAFISLQKDPKSADSAVLGELTGVIDLTRHLADFADTAALISCLDLVVTVDTSVAHLAGALGCPTWTLLSHTPDYRWLLDRDDSPWYPTMRLFRQSAARDWGEVIERVRGELESQVASFGAVTVQASEKR